MRPPEAIAALSMGPRRWAAAFGSLKLRITAAGIASLVLGIGLVAALLVSRAEHDTLKDQRDREATEAARLAGGLSRRVFELQRALHVVALQLDAGTLDDEAALTRFIEAKPVLRAVFADVFAASRDGRMRVFADRSGTRRFPPDLSNETYFRHALEQDRPMVSPPLRSRMSEEPVVIFTQPLRNREGVYGVLGGTLQLEGRELLGSLLDTQEAEADALLVVTDAGGRTLAHPERQRLMQPLSEEPRLAAAFRAWLGAGSPAESQGMQLPQPGEVVSTAAVAGPEWMVWRARSEAELLAPLRAARRQALAWAGAAIALLSAALLGLLWWLLRPLALLQRRAQHLFDGTLDIQAGWPEAVGEIGHLADVLRHVGAERVRLEGLNAQVLARLGSVMSAAPVGIAFARSHGLELVSAEFCRLFRRSEQALVGERIQTLFAAAEDYVLLSQQVRQAIQADHHYVGEWQMQRGDGTRFWASLRGKPVDLDDPGAGTIWTITDISDQRVERAQLEWSATHDPLTGLSNRSGFEQRAGAVVAALPRSLPAALVLIDLDHFKPINDSAGHAAGDAMLRAVAAAMSTRVRNSDLIVRLGGDEFALLLERCNEEAALRVAQNVCDAIAAIELPWENRTLKLGASIGVAHLSGDIPTLAAWTEAADAACYAAKAAGRGVVRVAGSPAPAAATASPPC